MKHLNVLIAAVCAVLSVGMTDCVTASNSGKKTEDTLPVKKITLKEVSCVDAFSGITVEYVQTPGDAYAEIHASEEILPRVSVTQKGGCLKVGFQSGIGIPGNSGCKVKVYAPEISDFSASSAAIIMSDGLKSSKNVSLKASEAGAVKIHSIQTKKELSADVSGGAAVKVEYVECASSGTSSCSASEAGTIAFGEVKSSGNVSLKASEAGAIKIHSIQAKKDLSADVSEGAAVKVEYAECASLGTSSCSASNAGAIAFGEVKSSGNASLEASEAGAVKIHSIQTKKDLLADVSGSAAVKVESAECASLDINSHSAGACTINDVICADEANVKASSSGAVKVVGKCRNAVYNASAGGGIDARALDAEKVTAESSSAGSTRCYAGKEAVVKESDGGSVKTREQLEK